MSITTEVIKQPNAPMADVNIKMPSGKTRYFKLPAQNADSFAIAYKKQDKNSSTMWKKRSYNSYPRCKENGRGNPCE